MPPMPLVDEDAGDPPARSWRWFLFICALVLEQELISFPVLTPALRDTRLVEHQRRLGTALFHQLLLQGTRFADAALVLRMLHDAPASAVDPVVPSSRGLNDGAARVEDREPRRRRVDGREDPIRAGFATLFMEHTRIAARPPICPSLR
jgi:hypothetical protein